MVEAESNEQADRIASAIASLVRSELQ
jgi:hypothetical protein